jgi:cyclopropane-fatty-acyl-phospholipid synthase
MSRDHFAPCVASTARAPIVRTLLGTLDGLLIGILTSALHRAEMGRLHLTLPSGRTVVLGSDTRGPAAHLSVRNYRVFWNCLRRGPLGFADSYMAGDVDTISLKDFFDYYMDNEPVVVDAAGNLMQSAKRDLVDHMRHANTRAGSRRNIAAHYDIGNAFYRHWLDAGMTYSSGIYADATATLDQAQQAKYDAILAALDIRTGDEVLEIGCGWGGFVAAAAARGATVSAITISEQQFAATRERIASENLDDQASVSLEDYRDTSGAFDHIASIEMIEAVGEENWATYFCCIADRLKPGGNAVVQAITIRPDLYDGYRRNPDFVQLYIFPGGMLPTEGAMRLHAEAAGLSFERLQTFGHSYALTLAEWRRRFDAAWPRIAALGFDERFRRMWSYYFVYCEVGFERGSVDVGLYRMIKTP